MQMHRVIVTGANGAGKSHLAAALLAARPDVPVISFDAMKLTTNWKQRSRLEVDAELRQAILAPRWILEGGPSLLALAIARADGVIWLDPPFWLRAVRLIARPWQSIGRTRRELPPGNRDWPWEQYRFAIRSLRNDQRFRQSIVEGLSLADGVSVWHVRSKRDVAKIIAAWRSCAGGE